jgi:gas vesicle protein
MSNSSWIKGFIIGGVIGAGIALLKASRSGEETRAMLAERGLELRDKAVSTVDDTVKQVEKATKNIVDEASDRADRLKNIGRRVYQKEAAVMQDGVQEAKEVLKTK